MGQQGGGGADGGHPDQLVRRGLTHQRLHSGAGGQILHAGAAAGQHHHVSGLQLYLVQGQVGLYGDVVAAGDQGGAHGGQGDLKTRPAQQVGGHQGLHLLKTGGEQDIDHRMTSL